MERDRRREPKLSADTRSVHDQLLSQVDPSTHRFGQLAGRNEDDLSSPARRLSDGLDPLSLGQRPLRGDVVDAAGAPPVADDDGDGRADIRRVLTAPAPEGERLLEEDRRGLSSIRLR
jgi:hypothetical protein